VNEKAPSASCEDRLRLAQRELQRTSGFWAVESLALLLEIHELPFDQQQTSAPLRDVCSRDDRSPYEIQLDISRTNNVAFELLGRATYDETPPDLAEAKSFIGDAGRILWSESSQSWHARTCAANVVLIRRQTAKPTGRRRRVGLPISQAERTAHARAANRVHILNLAISESCKPPNEANKGCCCGLKWFTYSLSKQSSPLG
jgi:hypothetical protein